MAGCYRRKSDGILVQAEIEPLVFIRGLRGGSPWRVHMPLSQFVRNYEPLAERNVEDVLDELEAETRAESPSRRFVPSGFAFQGKALWTEIG